MLPESSFIKLFDCRPAALCCIIQDLGPPAYDVPAPLSWVQIQRRRQNAWKDLKEVLRCDPLTAGEILMSESCWERMGQPSPRAPDAFMANIDKKGRRGLRHRRGQRPGKRLNIDHFWEAARIVDVGTILRTVAQTDEGPAYERPYARPAWQDELSTPTPSLASALLRPPPPSQG